MRAIPRLVSEKGIIKSSLSQYSISPNEASLSKSKIRKSDCAKFLSE